MKLLFKEDVFKKCQNRQVYIDYIEKLVSLGRSIYERGIVVFEKPEWKNVTKYEQISIELLCEGCPPERMEFILTNLLETSDLTEDEYIRAVLFRAFVIFIQPGGISETDMRKILMSHFGIDSYIN
jgi:hypothetical protein